MPSALLALLLSIFSAEPIMAQDSTSSATTVTATPTPNLLYQYQQDYTHQTSQYQEHYSLYLEKDQVHQKYGTLTTNQDLVQATRQAMSTRNLLLKSYLMTLRQILETNKEANPAETNQFQQELFTWEEKISSQTNQINTLSSQDSIKTFAQDFQKDYQKMQQTIYSSITQNKINHQLLIQNDIQALVSNIKDETPPDSQIEDWFLSLQTKSNQVTSIHQQVKALMTKKNYADKFNNFYPQAKIELADADRLLSQMLTDLKSILIKLNNTK